MEFGSKVQLAAFEMGVAVYPGAGTADGIEGDHVLIAPPYTVSDAELEVIVTVLKNAYDKTVADLRTQY
jgi:adenosylmethionine-8-amino-7-oxononanoate aminotransferase